MFGIHVCMDEVIAFLAIFPFIGIAWSRIRARWAARHTRGCTHAPAEAPHAHGDHTTCDHEAQARTQTSTHSSA